MLDKLSELDEPTASLVQRGLAAIGLYQGSYAGRPGPKTNAAYDRYLASMTEDRLAKRVVELAKGEVGVREIPRNSNRGKRVQEYQSATWLSGTGWPWCAAFICWLLREAEKTVDFPFDRPKTAGAWDFMRWAKEENLITFDPRGNNKKILAGDILVYTFSHIGLSIGGLNTIEGNTDRSKTREGGGVYKLRRRRDEIQMVIRLKLA